MEHWFASADIIQNNTFSHIPDDYAKSPLLDIPPTAFIPDEHVIQLISKGSPKSNETHEILQTPTHCKRLSTYIENSRL